MTTAATRKQGYRRQAGKAGRRADGERLAICESSRGNEASILGVRERRGTEWVVTGTNTLSESAAPEERKRMEGKGEGEGTRVPVDRSRANAVIHLQHFGIVDVPKWLEVHAYHNSGLSPASPTKR